MFSEIYYPEGWTAKVSNEEVTIKRVNYVLRGLELPAGDYEIVFDFTPSSYTISQTMMWIFGLILILVVVAIIYKGVRNLNQTKNSTD